MRIFLLFFILLLNSAVGSNIFGQNKPFMVRFDPPSFVPANKNFNTSLVFKVNDVSTKSVSIKFTKPNSIKINSAILKTGSILKELKLNYSSDNSNEVTLSINRNEIELTKNVPYQIILNCFASKPDKIDKNLFSWVDAEIVKVSDGYSNNIKEPEAEETKIYEVQNTAGSSIRFNKLSLLQYEITEESEWKNLYIEFWIKSKKVLKNCFSIEKSSTQDTLVSFSKSKFGFITFPMHENEVARNDVYLGDESWNYIGIQLSNSFGSLKSYVYVNSTLAFSTVNDDNFNLQNLDLVFKNTSENGNFEIDRLKVWKYGNSVNLAQNNKHFLTFEADSSLLIYQSNFDNVGEFNTSVENKALKIVDENLEYVKSDAPLFSKAPKLTVNIGSSYNSIVWYVQEYSVAKEFVIERAISDGDFKIVFRTFADNDPLKIYYFTDELMSENEVAYYRVRQINKDESVVFSPEVKIGNKEIQAFNLSQNYPNPFNPITSIYVEVILPTEFEVSVYDLVGNKVSQLYKGYLAEGMHTFEFDGSSLPSGIYFYEVISPKAQIVKKMILAK